MVPLSGRLITASDSAVWGMSSDYWRAESENVPVGIHMSTLVLAPFSVLRHVDLGSRRPPLFHKRVCIVNEEVDRVPTARREEVLGNSEVDLDAVTLRESEAIVQILPSRKSKSLVVIERCIEVADGKDRGHSPYGCHGSKR